MYICIVGLFIFLTRYLYGQQQTTEPLEPFSLDPSHPLYQKVKDANTSNRTELMKILGMTPEPSDDGNHKMPFQMDIPEFSTPSDSSNLTDEELQATLKIYKGTYEQTRFDFQNYQNFHADVSPIGDEFDNDRCINEHMKCLMSQTRPMPVCALYDGYTFLSINSYCDLYADNCRRGYRVWRIVNAGKCIGWQTFDQSRRMNSKLKYKYNLLIRKIMGAGNMKHVKYLPRLEHETQEDQGIRIGI